MLKATRILIEQFGLKHMFLPSKSTELLWLNKLLFASQLESSCESLAELNACQFLDKHSYKMIKKVNTKCQVSLWKWVVEELVRSLSA